MTASERLQDVMSRWLRDLMWPQMLSGIRSDLIPKLSDDVPYRTGTLRSWTSTYTPPIMPTIYRQHAYARYTTPDFDEVTVGAAVARVAALLQESLISQEDHIVSHIPLTTDVLDSMLQPPTPTVYLFVDNDTAQTPLAVLFLNQSFYLTEAGRDHPKVPHWMRLQDKARRDAQEQLP